MQLKKCPFCGGDAILSRDAGEPPFINCVECECRTCGGNDIGFEVDSWNSRISVQSEFKPTAEQFREWARKCAEAIENATDEELREFYE